VGSCCLFSASRIPYSLMTDWGSFFWGIFSLTLCIGTKGGIEQVGTSVGFTVGTSDWLWGKKRRLRESKLLEATLLPQQQLAITTTGRPDEATIASAFQPRSCRSRAAITQKGWPLKIFTMGNPITVMFKALMETEESRIGRMAERVAE
jgi:hypothetical protein